MKPIHFFGGTLALLIFSAAATLTQAVTTSKPARKTLAGSPTESIGHFNSNVQMAAFSFRD